LWLLREGGLQFEICNLKIEMKKFVIIAVMFGLSACSAAFAQIVYSADTVVGPIEMSKANGPMSIDLATALRLANANNHTVALARERMNEAVAQCQRANAMLLPTITLGASVDHHEGGIQETSGTIRDINRSSGFVGLGAGATGAGPIQVPGVGITANLADAFFEPLAAKQSKLAAEAGSAAATNRVSLQVATAYFELVRAKARLAIATEAQLNAADLARVTASFAKSGQGLESDASRAEVEKLVRDGKVEQARENYRIRSIELAELLRLDGGTQLYPTEDAAALISLADESASGSELLLAALENRPEVRQNEALVKAAKQRLKQAKYDPFVPKVSVGFSAGGFGGGGGTSLGSENDRHDVSALVFWQLDNLGFGARARTKEQKSRFKQAEIEQLRVLDRIASEVREARIRAESRKRQLAIAAAAVKRARSSLELNKSRIYESQGLPIEVLQAIGSLALTRELVLDSAVEFNQAQFRLYTAIGQPGKAE
jgi:outer membrane protein TolC